MVLFHICVTGLKSLLQSRRSVNQNLLKPDKQASLTNTKKDSYIQISLEKNNSKKCGKLYQNLGLPSKTNSASKLNLVFEKCVPGQLDSFNIIHKIKSGFRPNFSTDTCLSYLRNKIPRELEKGEYTGMVVIDLQKAFDTIDHKILLHK